MSSYNEIDLRSASLVAYSAMGYIIYKNAAKKSVVCLQRNFTERKNGVNTQVLYERELPLDARFKNETLINGLCEDIEKYLKEYVDLSRVGGNVLNKFDMVKEAKPEKTQEYMADAVQSLCNLISKSANYGNPAIKQTAINTFRINNQYLIDNFKDSASARFYSDIANGYFKNEDYNKSSSYIERLRNDQNNTDAFFKTKNIENALSKDDDANEFSKHF